jgi:hypothetical protein
LEVLQRPHGPVLVPDEHPRNLRILREPFLYRHHPHRDEVAVYITNLQYMCALLSTLFMGFALGMSIASWKLR